MNELRVSVTSDSNWMCDFNISNNFPGHDCSRVSAHLQRCLWGNVRCLSAIILFISWIVPGTFLTTTRGEMTTSELLMMTTLAFVAAFQGYGDGDETLMKKGWVSITSGVSTPQASTATTAVAMTWLERATVDGIQYNIQTTYSITNRYKHHSKHHHQHLNHRRCHCIRGPLDPDVSTCRK